MRPPPVKVGKLQTALHTKAKNSPDYRFYALYDKVYRRDVLEWAFVRCLRNGGVPGVNGQRLTGLTKLGRDQWLDELAEELRKGTYQPQPVRRAFIPKADGKQRPLGIPLHQRPCGTDGYDAGLGTDFRGRLGARTTRLSPGTQRPGRRSPSRAAQVHTEVVDADLSGYFDSIPHAELMKSVSRRISDGRVLRLMMWLEAPVEETDAKGNRHRTTRNKDQGIGGGSRGSDLTVARQCVHAALCEGVEDGRARAASECADQGLSEHFVICCRGTAEEAMNVMRR